jgi:hypothetical protein
VHYIICLGAPNPCRVFGAVLNHKLVHDEARARKRLPPSRPRARRRCVTHAPLPTLEERMSSHGTSQLTTRLYPSK